MISKTREIFTTKGIVKGKNTKALEIFCRVCEDFTIFKDMQPSNFVKEIWCKYLSAGHNDNSINSKIFEYILSCVLINNNLLPFYVQAKVAFVPNADYDLLLYCKEKGPIVLSAKTSLRERYKQADLEAIALKYVYRKSESYLITIDKKEALNIQNKVIDGSVIGINKVIYAMSSLFDDFIDYLKTHNIEKAGVVEIITAGITVE